MNVAGRIPLAKIARTRRALRRRGRIKNGCRALRDRANFLLALRSGWNRSGDSDCPRA